MAKPEGLSNERLVEIIAILNELDTNHCPVETELAWELVNELRSYRSRTASGEWPPERIATVRSQCGRDSVTFAWPLVLSLLDALEAAQASALEPGQLAVDESEFQKLIGEYQWGHFCDARCLAWDECGQKRHWSGSPDREICRAALLAHFRQAGGLAGQVAVGESEFRALVAIAANSMEACPLCPLPHDDEWCLPASNACRDRWLAQCGLTEKEVPS